MSRYMHQNVVSTMPSERFATHYNMNHKHRGIAYIFNHQDFTVHGLRPRNGTQLDYECLTKKWQSLGFEVRGFQDLTYTKLEDEVKKGVYE